MSASAVRLVVLCPELMGTYGDGGNAIVLAQRLRWRGERVDTLAVPMGSDVPQDGDLYLIGGGEDEAQHRALETMRRTPGLQRAVDRGAPVLAICAGLQVLGTTWRDGNGASRPGLGLLDVSTTRREPRAVGHITVAADPLLGLGRLVGFENHGGATTLGPSAVPLGAVVTGVGNGAADVAAEGAQQGSILATYLHGPVLARNPRLADLLLSRVLGRQLDPLPGDEDDPWSRERTARPAGRRALLRPRR